MLRPSWFIQNVSGGQHRPTVRDERAIHSATGDGRLPLIDAEDIARVDARVLTDARMASGELLLNSPKALTYDDVAALLPQALGERVVYRWLAREAMTARFAGAGLLADFAWTLATIDATIADGAEDRVSDAVTTITGRVPTTFRAFAAREAAAWRTPGGVRRP